MVIVHRKVMFPTIILGVKFYPGMNSISDPEFKKLKEHHKKVFDQELLCGNMIMREQIESPVSEAVDKSKMNDRGAEMSKEISNMKIADAKKVISDINDFSVLKALKKDDGRVGIQSAIEKRMDEIQNQVGGDFVPVSKPAPEGTGDDFLESGITGSKADREGRNAHTAIPALKRPKGAEETL